MLIDTTKDAIDAISNRLIYTCRMQELASYIASTVEPRLSGPYLSFTSITWTCSTPLNALIRMHRGRN